MIFSYLNLQPMNTETDGINSSYEGDMPCHLVDVPSYPWDHSKKYWHESHLSKSNRFRSHGREDIIGAPLENSTPQDPRWRGFFRVQENPWLEDHVIQGSIIYPAGGMIAMVVEAAKQLADHSKKILGYEVTDFKIVKPMLIPTSTQGLEHMLSAHVIDEDEDAFQKSNSTYKFSILSKPTDGPWTTHCKGRFSVVYCKEGASSAAEMERRFGTSAQRQACRYVQKLCHTPLNPRQFYETLAVIGMAYGPQFRNLIEIERGDASAHVVIQIPDTKARMPFHFEFDHIIHPATLDTMLQTVIPLGDDRSAMLPCSAGRVFVSATLPKGIGSLFRGFTTAQKTASRGAVADITMFDNELCAPTVIFEDLLFKAVSRRTTPGSGGFLPSHRNLCSEIIWKQDVSNIATLGFDFPTSIQEIVDLASHKNPSLSILYHAPHSSSPGCESVKFPNGGIQHLGAAAEALKITKLILNNLTEGYETPRFSRCIVSGASSGKIWQHMRMLQGTGSGFERIYYTEAEPENEMHGLVFCSIDEQTSVGSLNTSLQCVDDDGWFIIVSKMGGMIDSAQYGAFRVAIQAAGFQLDSTSAKASSFLAAQKTPRQAHLEMASTAKRDRVVILLPDVMSPFVAKLKSILRPILKLRLSLEVHEANIHSFSNLEDESGNFILSLVEIDTPLITSMGPQLFKVLHSLLNQSREVFWLSQGGQVDCQNPNRSPFLGLARTLRSEQCKSRIVTLDISSDLPVSTGNNGTLIIPETLVNSIALLIEKFFKVPPVNKPRSNSPGDVEFAYSNGRLLIPRLMPLELLNRTIEEGPLVQQTPLLSKDRAMRLDMSTLQTADGPHFVEDVEAFHSELLPNEIRIAVAGTNLLPEDIIYATRGTPTQLIGTDVFGHIVEAGSGTVGFQKGSYVVARTHGTLKTHVIVDASRARRIEHPRDWRGSCPTAFATAMYALKTGRRIMKGDFVLIYGASSAYGQAAIRVALALGGNVLVACLTTGEKYMAQEYFKIPSCHILDMRGTSDEFETRVLAITQHFGVDVVFDPTSCHIEQAFACVTECKSYLGA